MAKAKAKATGKDNTATATRARHVWANAGAPEFRDGKPFMMQGCTGETCEKGCQVYREIGPELTTF